MAVGRHLDFTGEGGDEVGVGFGLGDAVKDALGGIGGVKVGVGEHGHHAAECDDAAVGLGIVESLVTSCAGLEDVNGGVDASLGEFAIKVDFHVAGALEFFVDDIVKPGSGVNEAGGDDGEGAGFFCVACSAEEVLGGVEGDGVHAAGECVRPEEGGGDVVGAGQAA